MQPQHTPHRGRSAIAARAGNEIPSDVVDALATRVYRELAELPERRNAVIEGEISPAPPCDGER